MCVGCHLALSRLQWNRPVHEFLLRHVYLETIQKHQLSRMSAAVVTFLVSIILHELVRVTADPFLCADNAKQPARARVMSLY